MNIWLFLPTFRKFVKNTTLVSEENVHPVFFYEDDIEIWFYKVIDPVLYYVRILKEFPPEDITIEGLKDEFDSTQIPEQLIRPQIFTGTIS